MKRFRHFYILLVALMIVMMPCSSLAVETPTDHKSILAQTPVLLNGEPSYVQTGNTNLTDLVTDAMRAYSMADIAILNAGAINASIPAGTITSADIASAFASNYALVKTTLSGREIKSLLNNVLLFSDEAFPLFSGIDVVAEKYQSNDGTFAARCISVTADGIELPDSELFSVITTEPLFSGDYGYQFSRTAQAYGRLFDAVTIYIENNAAKLDEGLYASRRMITWEPVINVSETVAALNAPVSDGITVYLLYPDTIPEAVMYALAEQNRTLTCHIAGPRPYSFSLNGSNIVAPSDVSLQSVITHNIPPGRREASSIDQNALYLDFSENGSLPSGTHFTVYVGDLYAPGSSLYLYYYDAIEDIVPYRDEPFVVDAEGNISCTVSSGITFFLNPYRLDATSLFDLPRSNNPFIPGIIVICTLFVLFTIVFLFLKHKRSRPS